jgi:hypothetical protein
VSGLPPVKVKATKPKANEPLDMIP